MNIYSALGTVEASKPIAATLEAPWDAYAMKTRETRFKGRTSLLPTLCDTLRLHGAPSYKPTVIANKQFAAFGTSLNSCLSCRKQTIALLKAINKKSMAKQKRPT